jgi:sensor histidine kinase YesM
MSELLRRILSDGANQFVSLRRELDLLEHYRGIQELRFPSQVAVGSTAPRPGVGLNNVIERLDTSFGGRAALQLNVSMPGRMRVDLTIPQA